MKNKSWIIILIMAIALTISTTYSIVISKYSFKNKEQTVTTTSIIEMTATTATIKNTLKGNGKIEYKKDIEENKAENTTLESQKSDDEESNSENIENNENKEQPNVEINQKNTYQIVLAIENKDLEKVKVGQETEINIKDEQSSLNYLGKVISINKDAIGKSTINIEMINPDDKIKEGLNVSCAIIIEKAENVVALPIEAIQKNEQNEEYVDVVQFDGTTEPVKIKTGLSDAYYVEITSGLSVGDRVQIIKSSTTVVNGNITSKNIN